MTGGKYAAGTDVSSAYVWTLNVRPAIRAFLVELLPHLRTQRVRTKAQLVIEDIDARTQGSRDPGYMVACHERREAVAALNRRGVA